MNLASNKTIAETLAEKEGWHPADVWCVKKHKFHTPGGIFLIVKKHEFEAILLEFIDLFEFSEIRERLSSLEVNGVLYLTLRTDESYFDENGFPQE